MTSAHCENNATGRGGSNFQVIMWRLINIWFLLNFLSPHVFVYRVSASVLISWMSFSRIQKQIPTWCFIAYQDRLTWLVSVWTCCMVIRCSQLFSHLVSRLFKNRFFPLAFSALRGPWICFSACQTGKRLSLKSKVQILLWEAKTRKTLLRNSLQKNYLAVIACGCINPSHRPSYFLSGGRTWICMDVSWQTGFRYSCEHCSCSR